MIIFKMNFFHNATLLGKEERSLKVRTKQRLVFTNFTINFCQYMWLFPVHMYVEMAHDEIMPLMIKSLKSLKSSKFMSFEICNCIPQYIRIILKANSYAPLN